MLYGCSWNAVPGVGFPFWVCSPLMDWWPSPMAHVKTVTRIESPTIRLFGWQFQGDKWDSNKCVTNFNQRSSEVLITALGFLHDGHRLTLLQKHGLWLLNPPIPSHLAQATPATTQEVYYPFLLTASPTFLNEISSAGGITLPVAPLSQ